MEYIREMLRRQRTALGRLMLGGGSAEEPETAAASPATERTSPAAPAPWETDGTASGTGGWEIRGNSFIERVEIYPERRSDGRIVKRIEFRFPVYFNGSKITGLGWDETDMSETVMVLSKISDAEHIDIKLDIS